MCSHQLKSLTATFLLVQSHQLCTPLSYTPADTYSTLCIGHVVPWVHLCCFLAPLLLLIFKRSPPPHLQTFSCDVTQLSLSWHTTQQTPLLLRTNLEPRCQRAAASHDGNMAHLASTETEKISRQDCIKGGQSEIKLSAEIKAINCCIYSTSVSTWCARAALFKAS